MKTKTKRKERHHHEVEEDVHDFFAFSLSSRARKMRRLMTDAGLPPIIEEEEPPKPLLSGQAREGNDSINKQINEAERKSPLNEEGALVLYKHVHFSTGDDEVDMDLISGLKI